MAIRIGYACINTTLPSASRTCRLSRAAPEKIIELARENLGTLLEILRFNLQHGIALFRISSGTIPFGSHPVNDLPWWEILQPELDEVGRLVRNHGLRVSMHPGQYTVLNSPRAEVVESSIAELVYHARFLDALGIDGSHKIVVHLGGAYGDPAASLERFIQTSWRLPDLVRQRLVIENDEKNFSVEAALEVSASTGAPVVFDVFHHAWKPSFPGEPLSQVIVRAGQTWTPQDGRQKIHYSDPRPGGPPGAHSLSVDLEAFLRFYEMIQGMELDVMLEVKDKERSVLALYERIPELRG